MEGEGSKKEEKREGLREGGRKEEGGRDESALEVKRKNKKEMKK